MPWNLKVGILGGTGAEGRGLALRLAMAGVSVGIGSRDQARAEQCAAECNERLQTGAGHLRLRGDSNAEVARSGEFVILAVPFDQALSTLLEHAPVMQPGSVVIDVTVPLVFTPGSKNVGLMLLPEGSGSQLLAVRLPAGIELVAALKTLPAHLLGHPEESLDCDEFVCGHSPEARQRTIALLQKLPGLRPIDVGSLNAAAALENLCALAVSMNRLHRTKGSRFRIVGL
jgi:8-hydroxy-5-deazaflavin:NADPH oxidoreductase